MKEFGEVIVIFKTLAKIAVKKLIENPELQKRLKIKIKNDILPLVQRNLKDIKPELKKVRDNGKELIKKLTKEIER